VSWQVVKAVLNQIAGYAIAIARWAMRPLGLLENQRFVPSATKSDVSARAHWAGVLSDD
jgi:hypothetical protein